MAAVVELPNNSNSRIEVRRSPRRKRSISAFQEGSTLVVVIPGHFTKAQEAEWVGKMSARMETRQKRRRPSDAELVARCRTLSQIYLDGAARPASVSWSRNQNRRWGSCTVSEGAIRVSDRLQGMPEYVLDYVLLHELTHLLHADHGPGFWALLSGYPHLEKAKGFLEGVEYQSRSVEIEPVDSC